MQFSGCEVSFVVVLGMIVMSVLLWGVCSAGCVVVFLGDRRRDSRHAIDAPIVLV